MGCKVSPDLISKVTGAVLDELREWQNRPLERVYAAIYLDAIRCKVRHEGMVKNKAAYIAIGIDSDGVKDVLGLWIDTTEGAKFWLKVCNELKTRGVDDVIFVCCDGLSGLPDAIEAVWSDALVQTCVVPSRASQPAIRVLQGPQEDRGQPQRDLPRAHENAALEALERLEEAWDARYPAVGRPGGPPGSGSRRCSPSRRTSVASCTQRTRSNR